MSQLVDISVRSVRLFVAGMMALASALLFVALLFEDFSALAAADPSQVPWSLMLRYVVSMTFGGAIAGYLLSGMFGRAGVFGWFLALAGGVFTSIFAGVLGSFVGLLPDLMSNGWQPTMLISVASGGLVLPFALVGWTALVVVWIAIVVATHLRARRRRFPT